MNRFIISEDVANLLPRMQVVVVTARNIDNSPPNDNVAAYSKVRSSHTLCLVIQFLKNHAPTHRLTVFAF